MQEIPWASPLDYAAGVKESSFVLLLSSAHTSYSGRYSLLALDLRREVAPHDWSEVDVALGAGEWFGYLAYELGVGHPHTSGPQGWLGQFGLVLRFDHEEKRIEVFTRDEQALRALPPPHATISLPTAPRITKVTSNFTKQEYLRSVESLMENIHAGDLYQANLTRKFFVELAEPMPPFALFQRLMHASPAPYGAFLQMPHVALLSSSPEQFLRIDSHGHIETRPIKGTAPRKEEKAADAAARVQLEQSEKDRAENLMIVDLMRHDLAQVAIPGSVAVTGLHEVTSHAHVHHMASTVSAQKRTDVSIAQVLEACFPPGSMTGTPKLRAIERCHALERLPRGAYSGALGWFGNDGAAELSVIIRTMVVRGRQIEFQVGGGIVADSTAHAEWQETLTKARGICAALSLDLDEIARL